MVEFYKNYLDNEIPTSGVIDIVSSGDFACNNTSYF